MSTQWIVTAHRLRQVREACLEFLDRWAVARLATEPLPLDRVACDVRQRGEMAVADASDQNWNEWDWNSRDSTFLYRGSVLDD